MTDLNQPLGTFKKAAKALHNAVCSRDMAACVRATRVHRDFSQTMFTLMQAQHVVAVECGFESWRALRRAPASELYLAIARFRGKRRLDHLAQARVREILRAVAAPIPEVVLVRPIHLISLFPIAGGVSATLAVAQRIADENARRKRWAIDLGHSSFGISQEQAARIKTAFEVERIPFWTRSRMGHYWLALRVPGAHSGAYQEVCATFGDPEAAA
jgi:hypothetical protein